MKHKSVLQSGFSIIELLISMAILGIIFVVANNLLVSAFGSSRVVSTQTNLQEELRSAAAIINDEVQRAYYVFPPQGTFIKTNGADVTVNWSQFNLGSSNMKTGMHGNTTFTVNSSSNSLNPQILAMITAPRDPTAPCTSITRATPTGADIFQNGQGCYQFVAYYGVLRTNVTRGLAGNSTTSSELLDNDPNNTGRLVLMEFRMNLYARLATSPQTNWAEVGCQLRPVVANRCLTPLTTGDPISSSQALSNSIPALSCFKLCDSTDVTTLPSNEQAKTFGLRMAATVNWINTNSTGVPTTMLVDYVNETLLSGSEGFKIQMPAATYDARGIFQVRLRLQGKISVNGKISTFPSDPISVYASPRNIAPLLY
jgi:prepilin-type N-terminal cleavage/methylation domain-containing protein